MPHDQGQSGDQVQVNMQFPKELKTTLQDWGQRQTPKWSLTRIIVTAAQEWKERNIPDDPENAELEAEIRQARQLLEDLEQKRRRR